MKSILFLLTLFSTYYLNAQRWTYHTFRNGLIDAFIYDIEEDAVGDIWVSSWADFVDGLNPYGKDLVNLNQTCDLLQIYTQQYLIIILRPNDLNFIQPYHHLLAPNFLSQTNQ